LIDVEIPEACDLVWTDFFDPKVGREQAGRRPAVVISPAAFFEASRFTIVCPITSRVRPFASSVVLPEGLIVQGEVLTSHIRSIDTIARPIWLVGQAVPMTVLIEIRAKLAVLTGIA